MFCRSIIPYRLHQSCCRRIPLSTAFQCEVRSQVLMVQHSVNTFVGKLVSHKHTAVATGYNGSCAAWSYRQCRSSRTFCGLLRSAFCCAMLINEVLQNRNHQPWSQMGQSRAIDRQTPQHLCVLPGTSGGNNVFELPFGPSHWYGTMQQASASDGIFRRTRRYLNPGVTRHFHSCFFQGWVVTHCRRNYVTIIIRAKIQNGSTIRNFNLKCHLSLLLPLVVNRYLLIVKWYRSSGSFTLFWLRFLSNNW